MNVLSCVLLPSPLLPFTVCVRWLFMVFRWERRGGVAVLCRESPASSVAQAGKEGERQNVNYCPPPFYTLHRLCPLAVRLLYARALIARCRCGCLFWEKDSAVAGLVHAFDSWQRCVWGRTHRTTRKSWPAFLTR